MSHLNNTHLGSQSIFLQSDKAQVSLGDAHKIFFLNEVINPPVDTVMLLALTSFEMPYSMYNFNANVNDKLVLSTTNGTHEIQVGSRNYDATKLAAKITSLLSLSAATTALGTTISATFDSLSNKFTFVSTNSVDFTILATSTMIKEIGFQNSLPSQSSNQILISPNIANLSGSSSIYVKIANLGIRNVDSRGAINGVISKVNITCNPNEFIFFQQQESIYYLIQERQVTHIELQLTDDLQNNLVLNGGSFSLTLTIHFMKSVEQTLNQKFALDKEIIDEKKDDK
jgi:hypothetical protein